MEAKIEAIEEEEEKKTGTMIEAMLRQKIEELETNIEAMKTIKKSWKSLFIKYFEPKKRNETEDKEEMINNEKDNTTYERKGIYPSIASF